MKKNYLIFTMIILALCIGCALFFLKAHNLDYKLSQLVEMFKRLQQEMTRLESEKQNIIKENEKLQTDAIYYLEVNNGLRQEKGELLNKLEEDQKIINVKEADLERLRVSLEKMDEKKAQQKALEYDKLASEKDELENKIKGLEEALLKEKALFQYNLGVAYAQAKLYDEAQEAYEKSLKIIPDNADAHYNLGLLYENFKSNPDKAILHYKKYLKLKPDADDKKEVEDLIRKLK